MAAITIPPQLRNDGKCLFVCPSVGLSVTYVPRHNSRMERPRKLKIGSMAGRTPITRVTRLEVILDQKVKGQGHQAE